MVAISATNSATVSLQVTLNRMRLEQARREADQAEAYAQSLRAQADDQEGVVQKARGQVQTLQERLSSASSTSVPTGKKVNAPTQNNDRYIQNLADIFEFAKPMLKAETSTAVKDVVTGSLLEATNVVANPAPVNSKAIERYGNQVADAPSKVTGKVINATA